MYMSDISSTPESEILRELRGARILVTGLTTEAGVDVSRAFADLEARLVIQTNDTTPGMTELIAVLSQSAADMTLFTHDISSANNAVAFAQTAAKAYGGFDAVINFASLADRDLAPVASEFDVELLIGNKLTSLAHLTQVIANRMRVVFSQGLILNVIGMPHPANSREAALAGLLRTALATLTKQEATAWADHGIRINAVGPRAMYDGSANIGACVNNEPDLAALALYLASPRGHALSGHVFDSDGIGARPI